MSRMVNWHVPLPVLSSATLPITFKCLGKRTMAWTNALPDSCSRWATINMDGTALYEALATISLLKVNSRTELWTDYYNQVQGIFYMADFLKNAFKWCELVIRATWMVTPRMTQALVPYSIETLGTIQRGTMWKGTMNSLFHRLITLWIPFISTHKTFSHCHISLSNRYLTNWVPDGLCALQMKFTSPL